MALTLEEIERMEQQAALSRRFNAASDDYVARNNPGLRAKEREQVLRAAEGDVFAQARQRRLDANREIARNDPGRYSSFERNALLGIDKNGRALIDRSERDILRQHELQMLRQQGFNSIGTEEAKARGLAMNGMEAARIGADSRVRAAEIGAAADVQKANLESGSAKARFGWFDESGTYHPGSDVNAAERTGAWQLGKQNLIGEQKLEQINKKGENEKVITQEKELGKDRRQERTIDSMLTNQQQKSNTRLAEALIDGELSNGKDMATVLSELGKAYQDNPDMLGAITSAVTKRGQPPNNASAQSPAKKIPGYSQAKIEELQKRGYTWQNGKWVKAK